MREHRALADDRPPALLACPGREQHSLPQHALGAALSEVGCPCRMLGASVPAGALVSAVRQLTPRTVFIWAQTPICGPSGDEIIVSAS